MNEQLHATQSAELDALREEVELGQMHYRHCNNALNKERARAQSAEATIAQLRDRVAGLEEGLAWYGEQARLARLIHSEGNAGRWALSEDGGAKARALITKHGDH